MAQQYDVIVVGAGVVGSAMGYALGTQGRKVLVVEKSLQEPDLIVGELMQPAGVHRLRDLGMEGCLKGIDSPDVHGYGVFLQGRGIKLSYPKDKNGKLETGSSFHHGKFICALRDTLSSNKNVELVQGTVKTLIEESGKTTGVVYKSAEGEMRAHAPLTIVCDGRNSSLRNGFKTDEPSASTSFVGVIIKDTPLPFPNHGHVILTNQGPILAYQIGTHDTRLLVDVPLPMPANLQQHLLTVTAPQLPESLRESFITAVNEKPKPQYMKNSRLDGKQCLRPGVLLLGDAFNMRHPLTGGGMTVGLSDVVVTRDLLANVKDLTDTANVTKRLQQLYEKRKGYASTINILSWALYHVFTATNDPILPEMRKACIEYLDLGGPFTAGPVSLLSGLNARPASLMRHFFAVALYAVYSMLRPFPTPRKLINSFRLLSAASNIVVPLVRSEGVLSFLPILCRLCLLTGGKPKPQIQPIPA